MLDACRLDVIVFRVVEYKRSLWCFIDTPTNPTRLRSVKPKTLRAAAVGLRALEVEGEVFQLIDNIANANELESVAAALEGVLRMVQRTNRRTSERCTGSCERISRTCP